MNLNVPFLLYLLAAAVHLFFCLQPQPSLGRKLTKCLMMPLLLAFYLLSAGHLSWLVTAALLLGWGGDIFLLVPGKKAFFLAGLVSFLLGHAAYAAELANRLYIAQLSRNSVLPSDRFGVWGAFLTHPAVTVTIAIVALAIGAAAYFSLRKQIGKDMKLPVVAYLAVILVMAGLASLYAFPFQDSARNLVFIGSLLFVTSDYILARGLFLGEKKYGSFFVMLTYLAAQLLIVLGLCLRP